MGKQRHDNVFTVTGRGVYVGVYRCNSCEGLHLQYVATNWGKPLPKKIDSYCGACGQQGATFKEELQVHSIKNDLVVMPPKTH